MNKKVTVIHSMPYVEEKREHLCLEKVVKFDIMMIIIRRIFMQNTMEIKLLQTS